MKQFKKHDISSLFSRIDDLKNNNSNTELFKGKILGTIFQKNSLRTKYGFSSVFLRDGGSTLDITEDKQRSGPNMSEEIHDVIKIASQMVDILVVRLSKADDIYAAKAASECPVVNAGNGIGKSAEHPTQALSDIYFISRHFKSLANLNILLVGIGEHRVIRSLCFGFAVLGLKKIYIACSKNGEINTEDTYELNKTGMRIEYIENVSRRANHFDVIYHNGVSEDIVDKSTTRLRLTRSAALKMRKTSLIMHSLPRVQEYPLSLDLLDQAVYFEQARNANYLRRQILRDLL